MYQSACLFYWNVPFIEEFLHLVFIFILYHLTAKLQNWRRAYKVVGISFFRMTDSDLLNEFLNANFNVLQYCFNNGLFKYLIQIENRIFKMFFRFRRRNIGFIFKVTVVHDSNDSFSEPIWKSQSETSLNRSKVLIIPVLNGGLSNKSITLEMRSREDVKLSKIST